jgi:hypothetical protein
MQNLVTPRGSKDEASAPAAAPAAAPVTTPAIKVPAGLPKAPTTKAIEVDAVVAHVDAMPLQVGPLASEVDAVASQPDAVASKVEKEISTAVSVHMHLGPLRVRIAIHLLYAGAC